MALSQYFNDSFKILDSTPIWQVDKAEPGRIRLRG